MLYILNDVSTRFSLSFIIDERSMINFAPLGLLALDLARSGIISYYFVIVYNREFDLAVM